MADPSSPAIPPTSLKKSPTDEKKSKRQLNEASTRRVWAKKNHNAPQVPPGLESVGTTERDATFPYFERSFGNPTYPPLKDIEAQASITDTTTSETFPKPDIINTDKSVRVTAMEIMHNWTQEIQDGNLFVATINVLKAGSVQRQSSGKVIWLHVETPLPSLSHIEDVFRSRIQHMLKPYVKETTISLLHRVRTECERKFVLGRYLSADVPCLFLNFPFLAKGNFEQIKISGEQEGLPKHSPQSNDPATASMQPQASAGLLAKLTKRFSFRSKQELAVNAEAHPARTLLQSKYRLESTSTRDKKQAILSLPVKDVYDCISLPKIQMASITSSNTSRGPQSQQTVPSRSRAQASRQSASTKLALKRQKLFIPQLWSLSLSGDIMLTCGPLSLDELCGSELTRKDYDTKSSKSRHKVVRFNVENDFGKNEDFIYPADRCDWFFGLLNKQRKIEEVLGKSSHVLPMRNRRGTCLFFYTPVYRPPASNKEEVVNCDNWLQIQSQHEDDYLDLYLETRKTTISDGDVTSTTPSSSDFLSPDFQAQRQPSHIRSTSAPASAAIRPRSISPRHLLKNPPTRVSRTADPSETQTSRTRSVSPISFSLSEDQTFFEWPFREEINENVKYSKDRRLNVWLAKVSNTISKLHGQDIHPTLQEFQGRGTGYAKQLRNPVGGSDYLQINSNFFLNGPANIQDPSTAESDAAQKVFARATTMIQLFIPESHSKMSTDNALQPSVGLIHLYWGLILRMLDGIASGRAGKDCSPKELADTFQAFVHLAKRIHKGVWKMKDEKNDPNKIKLAASAVIQLPLTRIFERLFDLLFTIIATVEGSMQATASETVQFQVDRIMDEFENVEDNLTQEADENRYQKGLGPIVTPESITLLLVNRLSHGLYRNGTINVIEVYEKLVERLAYKVELSPSRLLLLEINRVLEEVDIVLDTFSQQKRVLEKYRSCLNPDVILSPSVKRQTRFVHEKIGIEKLEKDVVERIQHCSELRGRIKLLAEQNLQRVEAYQEDNNKKLMLFTVVTVTFLPLSFVTSFLGMNVVGVRDTQYDATQFWKIAVPLTVGLLLMSLLVLYWDLIKRLAMRLHARFTSDDEGQSHRHN